MSAKQKLILILSIPLILIIGWISIIILLIGGKNNNKASIIEYKSGILKNANINKHTQKENKQNNLSNKHTTSDKGKINKYTLIKVYIPKYFQNNGRKPIVKNLKKEKIIVKFVDYQSDKLLLKNLALGKLDIALIPLDKFSKYKPYIDKINFQNPNQITTIFNFLFNDYINNENYTIIPFSIDPLVTFISNKINLDEIKFENIYKYFFVNPKYWNGIDINLGLDSIIDKIFLKKNKEPFKNFNNLLYTILFQSAITQNSKYIKTIVKRTTNKNFYLFNSLKFLKYKLILEKRNKNCDLWTDICLANLGKIKILFGPLSDLDISNTIFPTKNKLSEWKIYNFPYYGGNIYFVRGRGLIVNKKSKHKIQALKFINEYIKQGLNGNFKLWTNTLSAFNNIYEKQKLNLKYSKLINYEDYFELLNDTNKKIKYIFKNTKFLDAIEGKYNIDALFNNDNFLETILNN